MHLLRFLITVLLHFFKEDFKLLISEHLLYEPKNRLSFFVVELVG